MSTSKPKDSKRLINVVRNSLNCLGDEKLVRTYSLRLKADVSNERISVPQDSVSTAGSETSIKDHLLKLMEYLQCFLVYYRIGKNVTNDLPNLTFDTKQYRNRVAALVEVLTSTEDADRRYPPLPYFKQGKGESFIDVAGFVVVFATDFCRKNGAGDKDHDRVAELAHSAMRFLVDPATFIANSDDNDSPIGWSFTSKRTLGADADALKERHVFPTARAIVAIQRYVNFSNNDPDLATKALALLPRARDWIQGLIRNSEGERFIRPREKNRAGELPDHLYATEAVVALGDKELKVDVDREVVVDAVKRLVDNIEEHRDIKQFDTANYAVLDGVKRIYEYRTATGTFLAIMSQAMDRLTAEQKELRIELRNTCGKIERWLMKEKDHHTNLWEKDRTLFQSQVAAVEGLLRFQQFAMSGVEGIENLTWDRLEEAVYSMLDNSDFRSVFNSALLKALNDIGIQR